MNVKDFKIDFYGQVAHLSVGGTAMILFYWNVEVLNINMLVTNEWYILLLIAYVLGHFFQGICNLFTLFGLIKENKTKFSKQDKKILESAKSLWQQEETVSESLLWGLCYMDSLRGDFAGIIEKFNTFYGFYRSLAIVFLLESIFFLFLVLKNFDWYSQYNFLLLIFLIATAVFYRRSKRFWNYVRQKVFLAYILTHNKK